jgi:hypothetical protein
LSEESEQKYRGDDYQEPMQYAQDAQHGFQRKQVSLCGCEDNCPQNVRAEQSDDDYEEL